MAELPKAPVTKLIKNAGAGRVREDATEEMAKLLEAKGKKIAKSRHPSSCGINKAR